MSRTETFQFPKRCGRDNCQWGDHGHFCVSVQQDRKGLEIRVPGYQPVYIDLDPMVTGDRTPQIVIGETLIPLVPLPVVRL